MQDDERVSGLPVIQYDYISREDEEMEELDEEEVMENDPESEQETEDDESDTGDMIEIDEYPAGKREKKEITINSDGITIRRTKRSFFYNYILASLILVLIYLARSNYGLTLAVPPQNLAETLVTTSIAVLVGSGIYLFSEPLIDRKFRKYVITNNEVIKSEGIFRRKRVVIPYQSISNLDVYKGVLGRALNFGDIRAVGFKSEIVLNGIENPELFYRIIQNKVSLKSRSRQKTVKEKRRVRRPETKSVNWRKDQKELEKRLKYNKKKSSGKQKK